MLQGAAFSRFVGGKANVLGAIYTKAYSDLIRDMNDFAKTPFQRDRAMAMLRQVDATVAKLDAETRKFITKELPDTYFTTAKLTQQDIKKLGVNVGDIGKFSQVHYQATQAMSDDAMLKFGHTMTGIKRSAEQTVQFAQQKAVREIIGAGQLQGRAAVELAKEVKAKIAEDGITALIDKGGKTWQMDTYAEMLTRQVLANSGREGVGNMAREYGFDLVQISDHSSEHPECADWEGEIVSLSGKTPGYPTLQDAIDAGLLHVGCRHGYSVVPGIAKDIPADFKVKLSDGNELPVPDQKTYDALKAMKYEPGDKMEYVTTAEGQKMAVKKGEMHRWVDDRELQSIIDTGKLSPTPENKALESGGGYYGRPGHKDFAMAPDSGKMFLEDLRGDSQYEGSGMHHLVLHVEDIPRGVEVHNDTRTVGSVSLNGSVPMENLSIVESMGSKILPGAGIDWRGMTVEKK